MTTLTFEREDGTSKIYLEGFEGVFGTFDLETRDLTLSPTSNQIPYNEKMSLIREINDNLRGVEPHKKSFPSALYEGDEKNIKETIEDENRGDYGYCPMCGADLINGSHFSSCEVYED